MPTIAPPQIPDSRSEQHVREETTAIPTTWSSLRILLRLTFGGAICGSFLGIFVGALCGIVYGMVKGDVSLGLDGAILGSVILAGIGLLYGASCGIRDCLEGD